MKPRLLTFLLSLLALTGFAQTQTNDSPGLGSILQMSNVWVAPNLSYAWKSHAVGEGIGIGYTATPALAPIVRFDRWQGKFYTAQFGAAIQAPRVYFQKFHVRPIAYVGVETPLQTEAGVDVTTDAFVGAGAVVDFTLFGHSWFTDHIELYVGYENHFALPEADKRQLKAAAIWKIVKF